MVVTMLQIGNSVLAQTFGIEMVGTLTIVVAALILYAKFNKGYEAIDKKFVGREKLNMIAMAVVMATTAVVSPGLMTGMVGQVVSIITSLATIVYSGFILAFVVEDITTTTSGFLSK